MHLVFRTPSRHCPFRTLNGKRIHAIEPVGHRYVRRVGRSLPVYAFQLEDGGPWLTGALADEVVIVTDALIAHEARAAA